MTIRLVLRDDNGLQWGHDEGNDSASYKLASARVETRDDALIKGSIVCTFTTHALHVSSIDRL